MLMRGHGRIRAMAKHAWATALLLAVSLVLYVAGLLTIEEGFRRIGLSLESVGAIGLLVWLYFYVRHTRKEIKSLKEAARATTDDPRSRLGAISHRLETLMNTWETFHPAGEEAWRAEENSLSQEAEQIISDRYPEEAASFRGLKPDDANECSDYMERHDGKIDEVTKREFLLQAKIKFLYQLVHGSGN